MSSNSSSTPDEDSCNILNYLEDPQCKNDTDFVEFALKCYQKAVEKQSFSLALKYLKSVPQLLFASDMTQEDLCDDLYKGIEWGAIEYVQYLVDGLQVPLRPHRKMRMNVFEFAIFQGQLNMLPFIREELGITTTNSDLLIESVQSGRFELFRYLVEELGLRVEKPEPLMLRAIFISEIRFVEFLYERIGIRQISNIHLLEVGLYTAAITDDLAILKLLVEKFTFCFDVREVCPITELSKYSLFNALNEAVKREHIHVLHFAVDVLHLRLKTNDVNSPTSVYCELLKTAVLIENLEIFKYLLREVGVNPNLLTEEDNIVLQILRLQDEILKVRFLREVQRFVSEELFTWAFESATPDQLACFERVPRQTPRLKKRIKEE